MHMWITQLHHSSYSEVLQVDAIIIQDCIGMPGVPWSFIVIIRIHLGYSRRLNVFVPSSQDYDLFVIYSRVMSDSQLKITELFRSQTSSERVDTINRLIRECTCTEQSLLYNFLSDLVPRSNFLEQLPPEIVNRILHSLDVHTLICVCSLVCKTWNNIIVASSSRWKTACEGLGHIN